MREWRTAIVMDGSKRFERPLNVDSVECLDHPDQTIFASYLWPLHANS